jgi:hypothetical protein
MLIKVRTLTGKEIELDIEPDYRVSSFSTGEVEGMQQLIRYRSRRSRRKLRRKRVFHLFSSG